MWPSSEQESARGEAVAAECAVAVRECGRLRECWAETQAEAAQDVSRLRGDLARCQSSAMQEQQRLAQVTAHCATSHHGRLLLLVPLLLDRQADRYNAQHSMPLQRVKWASAWV